MDSFGDQQRDPERIPILDLNSTRIWSLGTSRGPLHCLPPQGVQMNFSETLPVLGSPILVDDPDFYLAVYNSYITSQLKGSGGPG